MYFAIIDASSEFSRLTTAAYGDSLCDIAVWFTDEFRDNYETYVSDGETEEDRKVLAQCEELCSLAKEDALDISDLEGLSFSVCDITIELYGVYDSYDAFKAAFLQFVSDKPKYVKIKPEENPDDIGLELERLNTLLIRASI